MKKHTDNYPTLLEILRLPPFGGCRILGGKAGLQVQVRGTCIAEVADYERWISPGELLITTGSAIADQPEALTALIAVAKRGGLSGVCIKPGRFLPQVLPPELIETADRLMIPLIEIPADIRFSDLTAAVLQEIVRRQVPEEQERQLSAYLHHLLYDTTVDKEAECQAALRYGLHLERPHILLLVQTEADPMIKRSMLGELSAQCRRFGVEVWSALAEENMLLLESSGDIFSLEDPLLHTVKDFVAAQRHSCVCGISRPYSGIDGIAKAHRSAQAALRIAHERAVLCLRDDPVGLIWLAEAIPSCGEMEAYIQRQLAPILRQNPVRRQEMLETLESWFQCGGNQRQMARMLHLHYNTVGYRLQQLWELLQKDPADCEARLSLEIALYIYRFRC